MNKTRKEIIELISDYMNKELSEGCYILDEFWYIQKIYKYTWKNNEYQMINWEHRTIDNSAHSIWAKILWHYDITAVLKYIKDIQDETFFSIDKSFIEFTFLDEEWIPSNEKIPNKPLHLFDEKQIKDLLKLLKLLWQNKN